MKRVSFLIVLIFSIGLLSAKAQDCKNYYYLNSSEFQMTTYDKKGEESGKLTYKVTDVNKAGNSSTASFTAEMVNEKGKLISKSTGKYKCTGGVFYVDAKASLPGDQAAMYKDMEVKADEIYIEYPFALTEGQSLKDVNFKMEVYNKSALHSTIVMNEINRKVEGKETITTPAGSWECWKISYEGKFKATMAPMNIGIPFNYQATEWYAPGVGVIKTETRNKNGKLMGTSLITLIKK